MNNCYSDNFDQLTKASLNDLKKEKIISSIFIFQCPTSQRLKAKISDNFSNSIDVFVGLKSSEHIDNMGEYSESLESSSYIVLIDKSEKELRITTSKYNSNEEFREIFGIPISKDEIKEIQAIKKVLVELGLKV